MKVEDVLARLKREGWMLVNQTGSHRQYKHPTKPGRVTVAGPPGKDIPPGTYSSIKKQAGWK
jgi:predicted RNA binding protein YcfA (HicA-like mRNA interferase family)